MKLIIATGNKNKIIEIKNKLGDITGIEIDSLDSYSNIPEIIEDGKTFQENAIIKARAISKITGKAVMADDSGLEVKALENRPGIYSARYGEPHFNDKDRNNHLLKEMYNIIDRKARFIAVIALIFTDGRELTFKGVCNGEISLKPLGEKGFGYDPVFYIPELKKSMAQLSIEEKNRISHRALALDQMKKKLNEILKTT